jgi:hypothetical protein
MQRMNGQGQQGQSGQNQLKWQQFSLRERARGEFLETCREHEKDVENDAEDAKFDVPVSTPTTSRKRTGRTGQPAEKHGPRKVQVQLQVQEVPTTDDVPHEQVQKAKTRAARRADDETPETPDVKLPTKRVRRSDYCVQRDDERRRAFRTLKARFQCQTATE